MEGRVVPVISERLDGELTHNLAQLRAISFGHEASFSVVMTGTLSRSSGLYVTSCSISARSNLDALGPAQHLNQLAISLPINGELEPRDFSVLLQLPRLITLDLYRAMRMNCELQDQTLREVLMQLPQVKRLNIRGGLDIAEILPTLSHLEQLQLCVDSMVPTFDWIRSFHRLRSLTIINAPPACDLSGIGSLHHLKELFLYGAEGACDDSSQLSFLRELVKLEALHLGVGHFHDAAILRGMRSLKTLTITTDCTQLSIKNIDALLALTCLQELNILETPIREVSSLVRLPRLRTL